ncbi:MAG: zinc-dependent metalloprotease family protein [Patescibacteria group bacterium]
MRKAALLLFFFWICDPPDIGDIRYINVCVLNDTRAPVKDTNLIRKSIEKVSDVYKGKVGISFSISDYQDYSGEIFEPVSFMSYGFSDSIGVDCSSGSQIAILFTNHSKEEVLGFRYNDALAESSRDRPVVVVYSSENPSFYFNSELHPLVLLLMHEIGHFFVGSYHALTRKSFLFKYANLSQGKWTWKDKRKILRNKYREFDLSPN